MPEIAAAQSFSWAAGPAWAAVLVAALGVATLIIRQVGPWRKQTTDAETRLRTELEERVKNLEQQLASSHAEHTAECRRRDAERSLDRHRINNLTQCLDALLLLLEAAPEKASESVARIKEMRAAQQLAEAEEKGIIHAAEIAAGHPVEALT